MAELAHTFVTSLSAAWGSGYWVTWHPSVRLGLGDVGARKGSSFVPITSLAERGVETVATTAATRDWFTWHSEGAVDITFKAAGTTSQLFASISAAHAGARVDFGSGGGVLVAYRDLSESRLINQPLLAEGLLRRFWAGDWDLNWAVVSHLVTAGSGTVLGASHGTSHVELSAGAAVGPQSLRLADLAAGVSVARSSGLDLEMLGTDLTPFFRLLGLRKRFLRGVEAAYGDSFPLRTGAGRPVDVPRELVEEALDEPDAVLENLPQGGTDLDSPDG